jgi:hypothetical protein
MTVMRFLIFCERCRGKFAAYRYSQSFDSLFDAGGWKTAATGNLEAR